jgi:hypothetical protein
LDVTAVATSADLLGLQSRVNKTAIEAHAKTGFEKLDAAMKDHQTGELDNPRRHGRDGSTAADAA